MNELLLTIPEAAARLRLGRTSVYELINSGDLTTVHFGRAVRVPASSIDQLIRHQIEAARANRSE